MNWIRVDGPQIHVSRSVSVIYVRPRVYSSFCGWYTSGCWIMEYCVDSCRVASDYLAWQSVWCVVGGTDILGCNGKFLYVFKIYVHSRYFLVSGLCRTFWSKCLPAPRQFCTCSFASRRHVDILSHCEAPLRVTVLCVCSSVEMLRFGTGRLCCQSRMECRGWPPRTPPL